MTDVLGKREINKARKRSNIVEAATRRFLEDGYAVTSMSAVADAVGGSKTTLWAYFSSKEEIFAAVVDRHVESFSKSMEDVISGRSFSLEVLREGLIALVGNLMGCNSVLLYKIILSEGDRFPEIREMFYARGPVKLQGALTAFLSNHFLQNDAAALTRILIAAVTGYRSDAFLHPVQPSKNDCSAFVDELLAFIAWPSRTKVGRA